MHVRIPASDTLLDVARIVRYWLDPDLLEHDHRTAALHNTKEDIVRFGSFKLDVEPKSVAIKGQRSGDIFDYEQRRYSGDFWLRHLAVIIACLEGPNHSWIGSVQGAVATWSNQWSQND